VSLAIAGIDAHGAGKLSWVELEGLEMLGFDTVVSRWSRGSRDA
jgi:hypothetical protein